MEIVRVLVVDDHPLMREALVTAIDAEPDLQVIGEAGDGQEAIEQARDLQPDVIIMDLMMPKVNGIDAIAAIHREQPQICILAITASSSETMVLNAVRSGALGYVLKSIHRDELLSAVRQVARGNPYLPTQVTLKLIRGVQGASKTVESSSSPSPAPASAPKARLTVREREVLSLLGQGLSNREIAARLVISEATVRSHIYHIVGKLGLENRAQAVVYAVREGLTGSGY